MLNFRNVNIVFIILLAMLIMIDCLYGIYWLGYLVLLVLYISLLFYGSYFVQSQFYMPVICKGNTMDKKIALTFDDGPLEKYTPHILEILQAYKVKATFFCMGKHAALHTELLEKVHEDGHTIGSHSYSHGFWFDLLTSKQMHADLQHAQQLFKNILNINVRWFRPPYGVTTPHLKKAVQRMQYTTIGWNVRSLDTIIKDEEKLLQRLQAALRPGSIFLFHDNVPITVKVLPKFLLYVQAQGFEIVPLQNLINSHPYAD